jgi:hypothetical protein
LADYRSKTRNWINPLLGEHRLDRLTPEHLDMAYAVMLRRGLSPSTVLKVHRILSRAFVTACLHARDCPGEPVSQRQLSATFGVPRPKVAELTAVD